MNIKNLSALCSLVTLIAYSSCTKDGSTPYTPGGINYTLIAPTCLLTDVSGTIGTEASIGHYEYDNLKRVIRESRNHDSDETIYTYQGNTIHETYKSIHSTGRITINEYKHFLNSVGFIQRTEDVDTFSSSKGETLYEYNSLGYLVREVYRRIQISATDTNYFYYYGSSYVYENGNQTKAYSLTLNSKGVATDSTLNFIATYYTNMPGKFQTWLSWVERKGRPNTNELQSQGSSVNKMMTVSYDQGPNGFPSGYHLSEGGLTGDLTLAWRCQ
ncbi:MAG: hypothetical protein V4651_04785 [Bacteroidota bacterium]